MLLTYAAEEPMKSRFSLLVAVTCMTMLASSAVANTPIKSGDVLKLSMQHVRTQYRPAVEYREVSADGRTLRILEAGSDWNKVLTFYKNAYANDTVLPGGITVGGYFVNTTDSYASVTLYAGSKRCVLRFTETVDGTSFALWRSGNRRR